MIHYIAEWELYVGWRNFLLALSFTQTGMFHWDTLNVSSFDFYLAMLDSSEENLPTTSFARISLAISVCKLEGEIRLCISAFNYVYRLLLKSILFSTIHSLSMISYCPIHRLFLSLSRYPTLVVFQQSDEGKLLSWFE